MSRFLALVAIPFALVGIGGMSAIAHPSPEVSAVQETKNSTPYEPPVNGGPSNTRGSGTR